MRDYLLILVLGILGHVPTQDITEEICRLYDAGDYKAVTSKYGGKSADLPYKALFHLGLSYYKQGKDESTIDIMDMCIRQNSKDSEPQYIKGKSLNFLKLYGKAIKAFNKAIAIHDNNGSYYSGLGDSYMSLNQLDKALDAYLLATKQEDCPNRPYQKIPLIYTALGKNLLSIEAYYEAKENLEEGSEEYQKVLFKIGQMESIELNNFEAKMALTELINLDPKCYKAYPILIQTYMKLRKYSLCQELKEVLYKAHESGELSQNLSDRFCFDQFNWDEKYTVKAYEWYNVTNDDHAAKHVFEIKERNPLLYSVLTTSSIESPEAYLIQKHLKDEVLDYNISLSNDSGYSDIKNAVMDVIMEKVEPIGK